MALNTQKIVTEAKELQGRINKFIEHYANLGKGITKALESYNAGVGSLEHRIAPTLARLSEYGIDSKISDLPTVIDSTVRLPASSAPDDIDSANSLDEFAALNIISG